MIVTLGLIGVIGYRVLAPNELLSLPAVPYYSSAHVIDERPFSELRAAPLVIDRRLRVYGEKWRVWSDGPVGGRYEATPYWALRRWPAQLVGVVAVTPRRDSLVISQWSDGALIAQDAGEGDIVWRTTAPVRAGGFDGRRTGAATVYQPTSLLTARTAGGDPVLVAAGSAELAAVDPATGQRLWEHPVPAAGCHYPLWTSGTYVAICTGGGLSMLSAADGTDVTRWTPAVASPIDQPEPEQCELGYSGCRVAGVGARHWLVGEDGHLTELPRLPPGAMFTRDVVVYPTVAGLAARPITGGSPLWTWNGQGNLVATGPAGVFLLTPDHKVLTLDPTHGTLKLIGCAATAENEPWRLGHVYPDATGDYLALERITGASESARDQAYFYGTRPMALVELYPPDRLPVWPGKFAACRPL